MLQHSHRQNNKRVDQNKERDCDHPAYTLEFSLSLFSSHCSIKILCDKILVGWYHHTHIQYFNVMLDDVSFTVVDPTRRLKLFPFRALYLDRIFR
jgi:hypothetical protein